MKYRIKCEGSSNTVNTPEGVYSYLVREIYKKDEKTVDEETHLRAVDVQCWCELATAGDSYVDQHFEIECVYNF